MNTKNVKFYCLTHKKEYMAHHSTKHCPLCDNEPAIRYTMKDHKSNERLIREYRLVWRDRFCKSCGEKISKYNKFNVRKSAMDYVAYKYCDCSCKAEYKHKKQVELIEKAEAKYCKACGKLIEKSRFKHLSTYLKASTCGSKSCIAKLISTRHNEFEIINTAFANIDKKYEI